MPQQNYYQVLGISQNATTEDIKKAYRELANKIHPDRVGQTQTSDGISMDDVNEAYKVLKDLEQRKIYDESLSRQGTLREMLIVPIDTPAMGSASTGALVPVREFDLTDILTISKVDNKQLTQMAKENLQIAKYLFKHKEKYFRKSLNFNDNRLYASQVCEIAMKHIELAHELFNNPEYHYLFNSYSEKDLLAFALHSRELCLQILAQPNLVKHFSYESLTALAQAYGAEFIQARVGQYSIPLDLTSPTLTPADIKRVLKDPRYKADMLAAKLLELGQKNETFAMQCLEDDELRNFLSNDNSYCLTINIVSIAAAHEATALYLLNSERNRPWVRIDRWGIDKLARSSVNVFQKIVKDEKLVILFEMSTLFELAGRYNVTKLTVPPGVSSQIKAYKLLIQLESDARLVKDIADSGLESLTLLTREELVKAGWKSQAIAERLIENAKLRQYLSDKGQVSGDLISIATMYKYETATLSLLSSEDLWCLAPTHHLFSIYLDYFTDISAQVFLKILKIEGFARALNGERLRQAIQKYGAEVAHAILTNTKLTPPEPSLQEKLTVQLLLNRGLKRQDAAISQQVQTAAELRQRQQQEAEELYQIGLSFKGNVAVARFYFQRAVEKEHLPALDKLLELAFDNIEHYLNTLQQAQTVFEVETLKPQYSKMASLFNEELLVTTLIERIKRRSATFSNKVSLESDPEFGLLKSNLENDKYRAAVSRAFIHCYKAVNSFSDVLSYYQKLYNYELTPNDRYEKLFIELYLSDLEQGIALADCASRSIPIAELSRGQLYQILAALNELSFGNPGAKELRARIIDDLMTYIIRNEPTEQQAEGLAQLGAECSLGHSFLQSYLGKVTHFKKELEGASLLAIVNPKNANAWLIALLTCHQYGFSFTTLHPFYTQNPFFETGAFHFVLLVCERLKGRTFMHCDKIKLAADPEYQFLIATAIRMLVPRTRVQQTLLHCYYAVGEYDKALACYEALAKASELQEEDLYVGCQIKTYKPYLDQGIPLQEAVYRPVIVDETTKTCLLEVYSKLESWAFNAVESKVYSLAQKIAKALIDYHIQHIAQFGIEPLCQAFEKTRRILPQDYYQKTYHAASQALVRLAKTRDNPLAIQADYEQLLATLSRPNSTWLPDADFVNKLQRVFAEKIPAYIATLATYEDKLASIDHLQACSLAHVQLAGASFTLRFTEIREQVARAELDARCADKSPAGISDLYEFYQQVKAEVPSEYRDRVVQAVFHKVETYVRSAAPRTDKLNCLAKVASYALIKDQKSPFEFAAALNKLRRQVEQLRVDDRLCALDANFNSLDLTVLYDACLTQIYKPYLAAGGERAQATERAIDVQAVTWEVLLLVYDVLNQPVMRTEPRANKLRKQLAIALLDNRVSDERNKLEHLVQLYCKLHTALPKEENQRLSQAALERILAEAAGCNEPAAFESYYKQCQAFKEALPVVAWEASLRQLQWHFLAKVEAHLATLTDKDKQCDFLKQTMQYALVKDQAVLGLRGMFAVTSNRYHFYGRYPFQQVTNEHLVSDIPEYKL